MRSSISYLITGILLLAIAKYTTEMISVVFGIAGLLALAIALVFQVREDWRR